MVSGTQQPFFPHTYPVDDEDAVTNDLSLIQMVGAQQDRAT